MGNSLRTNLDLLQKIEVVLSNPPPVMSACAGIRTLHDDAERSRLRFSVRNPKPHQFPLPILSCIAYNLPSSLNGLNNVVVGILVW